MFHKIGGLAVKYRFWIILGWVLAALLFYLFAPSLSEVGTMKETTFLPEDSESLRARELIQEYFPESGAASTVSLVFYHPAGLDENDLTYARQVRDWLNSGDTSFKVENVTSIFDNPQLASRLLSPDGTTMLLNAGLAQAAFESESMDTTAEIRGYLQSMPPGLEVYVSGQVGIYSDLFESLNKSIDLTTIITVVLVIVLLIAIYRSPVAALVPLFTIGIAFLVSRGMLGIISSAGLSIWSQLDVFLIVLVFGIGTDYCLFLVSRFREELGRRESRLAAMKHTVGNIGTVIGASALAVIVGLAGMAVARYQMIQTMGPVLGLAILITLLAALTLAPALASAFGRRLFWPRHGDLRQPADAERPGFWARVAGFSTGQPVIVIVIVLVVMLVPYIALPGLNRSFDQLAELPSDSESVAGFGVLEEHFDIGEMDPLTAVIVAPDGRQLTDPESLAGLARISDDLLALDGVVKVQSVVQPEETGQTPAGLTVSGQLIGIGEGISASLAAAGADPSVLFSDGVSAGFMTLSGYLGELAQSFPWVANKASYQAVLADLQGIGRTIAAIKADPSAALSLMGNLQSGLASFDADLSALSAAFEQNGNPIYFSPSLMAASPDMQELLSQFFSENLQATRLYIVLDAYPQSDGALTATGEARKALRSSLEGTVLAGSEMAIGGTSAELADVRQVLDEDFNRVMLVVIAAVFVVLALLLRSLIAPLYLLATVLLSYGTTLGIVSWIFQGIMGQEGISFMIPIIVFVLLVALGSDYNIFLMSRVREESATRPTRDGARLAAIATGGVITACGIILAGTFGVLVITPIRTLAQIGAAVAIGVLIDTFLVRALLVPAIASLLGRWNWWPSRRG